MKLDPIHDIQSSYRKLVEAMSRPGRIVDLTEEAGKLEPPADCYASTVLLARMLLDTEVTFAVCAGRQAPVLQLFSQLTYARETPCERADFIFVLHDAGPADLRQALEAAKIGDLENPHASATVIIETEGLSDNHALKLSGPGIQSFDYAQVGLAADWVGIRAQRNIEFPLGIDLIFVDSNHRLLGLPRTIQIESEASV